MRAEKETVQKGNGAERKRRRKETVQKGNGQDMKEYEEFIEGLQQEVEVPGAVWSRYVNTLEHIEQLSEQRKDGHRMNKNRNSKWVKAAAVAGVLAAGTVLFSYANPVAASGIPLLGRIFEQVSGDATYSGSYENRTVLSRTDKEAESQSGKTAGSETKETGADRAQQTYSVSDRGITLTASEVYCDGYSVYFAAELKAAKGGFSGIPAHYTRRFGTKTSQSVHVAGTYRTGAQEQETTMNNCYFEGKATDDHTFIGMLKLDNDQYTVRDGELCIHITEICYDDQNAPAGEEAGPQHRMDGSWELKVPYTVDTETVREISVQKKNRDGYGIEKVFISPYQLIVFTQVPYTTLSPDTYTREDFEKQWGTKNKEISAAGNTPVTYEEMLAKKMYEYSELAVYNQDGEALEMQYGDETRNVFAVQEHELSGLRIYMGDASSDLGLIKAADEQEAKERSILEAEVDL